tara:strand:- start:323 stop:841 length:519 start_codon:yes stop_codon:yes gene_type:complete
MKIKIFPIFLIIFFSIVFFIFYKGLQKSNIYTPNINIKKNIPIFETKILDSAEIVNSENYFLNNKFYLVNIWASWCVPCRKEHRFLNILSKKENIEIIGLNYKDNTKNAKEFINELGNPYSVIFLDLNGTIAIEWGAYGVPETFLVYNKKIIKKIIGPINNDSFIEINRKIK